MASAPLKTTKDIGCKKESMHPSTTGHKVRFAVCANPKSQRVWECNTISHPLQSSTQHPSYLWLYTFVCQSITTPSRRQKGIDRATWCNGKRAYGTQPLLARPAQGWPDRCVECITLNITNTPFAKSLDVFQRLCEKLCVFQSSAYTNRCLACAARRLTESMTCYLRSPKIAQNF
eukprot:1159682-Pelagomonas_calceolata.AAC.7